MNCFTRKTTPFLAAAPLLAGLCITLGCSEAAEKPEGAAAATVTTYQTRGEIVALPAAGSVAGSADPGLSIRHEAIPDFTDAHGEKVGMKAMTMPFPPADGLDLAGFAVGDKVAVTFEVTWGGEHNGWQATALEKLPDDTELDFSSPPATHDDHADHADHDHAGHGH